VEKPRPTLLSSLYSVVGHYEELNDRQLLDRFTANHEQAAFAALVRRHGGMVLRVCRRVLHNEEDAEDAFQAVCVVLARKAAGIGKGAAVAAWLHKVAYRVALRARADLARRYRYEQKVPKRLTKDPLAAITGRELLTVLDKELQRLPEPWRAPLILCYLEEQTRDEASRQLGVSSRSLGRRLQKGRELLRRRLECRGLTLPAAFLAASTLQSTAKAAVPGVLAAGAIQAGLQAAVGEDIGGLISTQAAKLATGTLRAMALTRVIKVAAVIVVCALVGTGVGVSAYRQMAPDSAAVPRAQLMVAAQTNTEQPKNDKNDLTLVSRVVDDTGKALPGVEVAVMGLRGETRRGNEIRDLFTEVRPLAQGQTNQEGRFRFTDQRKNLTKYSELYLLAGKPGYGLTIERVAREGSGSETVLRLPPETLVRGQLLDLQGQPARGVDINVMLGHGAYASVPKISFQNLSKKSVSFWPDSIKTDNEGKFILKGLSAHQRAFLLMQGGRFMPEEKEIKFTGPGRSAEVKLALYPAQIVEGVITAADTGKPLPNVKLLMRAGKYAFVQPDTAIGETDSEGHYQLTARPSQVDKLPGKEFTISADPGNGPYLRFLKTFPWPQAAFQHTLNIALPRGVLVRGKVTQEGSGKPVASASVYYHEPKWPARSVKTGPDGIFEIVVPPGRRQLLVHSPSGNYIPMQITQGELEGGKPSGGRYYADALISFAVKVGTAVRQVEAKLRPGVTIRGRLLRPDGEPVTEAVMVCWNSNREEALSSGARSSPMVQVRNGQFELRGCDANQTYPVYFLDAKNHWGVMARLSAKESEREPVTVRLAPCGKAVVRVVKKGGEPLGGTILGLSLVTRPEEENVKADEVLVRAVDRVNYRGFDQTDKQGRCTYPALIPGATYRFSRLNLRSVPDIVLKPGETRELPDIVIDRPG
jgi:RNA polymerase sigma factor (sigma-70 family)